jgi:hypothetical protein
MASFLTVRRLNFCSEIHASTDVYFRYLDPHDVRRWAKYEASIPVASTYPKAQVLACLFKHNQVDSTSYLKNL